jgi:serine/threonine-protein kinase
VCSAVQFAHQNLVVHRDLKPSNILVADDGTVKLLDFGIARLLADDDESSLTVTGLRMLTPRYASPEQAAGRTVTTASDLYSLGVILYELLTGLNPREAALAEESVTDAEPPSAAVLKTGSVFGVESPDFEKPLMSGDTAARTHRLARELRGDLDTIVLRAMKHDPRERFDSASSLEDDLRRYRQGLPIESRPDSAAYRFRKFVRRHRTGVAAAAIVAIAIAGSAVFSLGQAQRARQERDTAEEVASLLEDLFWSPNPLGTNTDRPDTLRIRDLMATAATRVRNELSDQPAVQARLLSVLGNVHRNLGLYDEATRLHRDGLAAARLAFGERDANVAAMYSALGHTLLEAGQLDAADSAFTRALELGIESNGDDALPVAETRELYSRLLLRQRRFEETIPLLEASIAVRSRHLGDGDPLVATSLNSLAAAYTQLGRTADATPVLARAIEITRRELGDDHPNLATMLHNLAFMYRDLGRFDEAEPPARDAVSLLADRLGDDHPDVARARANLAQILDELDRHEEADSLFISVIETYRQRLGAGHPAVPIALANYGAVRRRRGDLDSAAILVSRAVDIQRAITGDEHPSTAIVTNALASVYIEQERFAEALPLLEHSLPIFESAFDAQHPRIIDARTSIGRALTGLGRLEEAERVLEDAYERAASRGDDDPRTQGVLRATAELLDVAGRTAEADSVRSKLPAGR